MHVRMHIVSARQLTQGVNLLIHHRIPLADNWELENPAPLFFKTFKFKFMKQNLTTAKKETATERINKKINELCLKHSFITWDMIGVDPYTRTGRHRLTYEGGIVY